MELLTGDLLFLDLAEAGLPDAIADVTCRQFGVAEPRLSHVGIIAPSGGTVYEARDEVRETPLAAFLAQAKPESDATRGWYQARLRPERAQRSPAALAYIRSRIGAPYDDAFLMGGERHYCADLIARAFEPLFEYRPMYFGEPGDPSHELWRMHFASLGMEIPAGKPGISPLGIYLSDAVTRLR